MMMLKNPKICQNHHIYKLTRMRSLNLHNLRWIQTLTWWEGWTQGVRQPRIRRCLRRWSRNWTTIKVIQTVHKGMHRRRWCLSRLRRLAIRIQRKIKTSRMLIWTVSLVLIFRLVRIKAMNLLYKGTGRLYLSIQL
jgi:hypothetical protein